MARTSSKPKSRTTLLAEALEDQRVINRNLAKIDLRSAPTALREPVKEARKAGDLAERCLGAALQADAGTLAVSA